MPTHLLSFEKHWLSECESTNMYAIGQIHAGLAKAGDVFHTPKQTQGKGQRGKKWVTAHGQNLTMSLVLNTTKFSISQHFRLSAAMALAAANFYKQFGAKKVCIKWPNDIFIDDRKAGGILIENVLHSGIWKWSVAGMGLNINQENFPEDLAHVTSLALATQHQFNLDICLERLLHNIQLQWNRLGRGEWDNMLADYNHLLYGKGTVCRLRKDNAIIPCLIRRVNNHGILMAGEMEEFQFDFGEVSWLLDPADPNR